MIKSPYENASESAFRIPQEKAPVKGQFEE
jgi:hypothetical protein